ncbi:helix-turn-helix domain-containing protein [Aquimarina sp. 2201CG14-23]|uniref:helix-turn-helix domain-containing protein n=1 Tax=Aquimarina mycalae TaxID=3040073 RepID=UPI002477DC52|nr:helix-turn-helix domain-containing protein [Aquimarina sp. 2201CG14-23]MDH7445979.1 helix-turn-helix domain-containing protein [Aquimarina sp. 2201CG14-23]
MNINKVSFIPLTSIPFPYKYLMAVGFYFYVKHQIAQKHKVISNIEYLLFLPALMYGILRGYWYYRIHIGLEKDLFWNVYKTGFFVYNDFVYLTFGLIVMFFALRFIKNKRSNIKGSISKLKNWDWLFRFSWAYTIIIILNLLHQIIANVFNLEHSAQFYYVILILNTLYIYWIGFVGFSKANLLFNVYDLKDSNNNLQNSLKEKLEYLIKYNEIYTNKNVKISDIAAILNVSEKELSIFIHETYQLSFSDYLNIHRVEKVKTLLASSDQNKFTLVAISEQAGFSSKSSFYAVFKKLTGLTPTQYKKTLEK